MFHLSSWGSGFIFHVFHGNTNYSLGKYKCSNDFEGFRPSTLRLKRIVTIAKPAHYSAWQTTRLLRNGANLTGGKARKRTLGGLGVCENQGTTARATLSHGLSSLTPATGRERLVS